MGNCCTECFQDNYLKEVIIAEGVKGNCDYCNSKNVSICNTDKLKIYFEPFLNLYGIIRKYTTGKKKQKERNLWDRLTKDWEIFGVNRSVAKKLLKDILDEYRNNPILKKDVRKINFLRGEDSNTPKMEDIWDEFSEELKHSNRYFPIKEIDKKKLVNLLQYLEYKIPKNKYFYRARNSYKGEKYQINDLGLPPRDKTQNGRANPVGISYLYLASNLKTSISEIRPSLLDRVTVGKFRITKDLIVIDLRHISPFYFALDEDFENLLRDIKYLAKLGSALSKPLNPLDTNLEYLPTQYLCEFIKRNDWDGVLYKSALSDGFNLALFTEDKVECKSTTLHQIQSVGYDFKQIK